MPSVSEEELQSDRHRPIVRMGDTVRRPAGWWTPAIQFLLQHLHDVGFEYSPRPGGIDSEGREVVSYVAGESGATGWHRIQSEKGLRRFATLLRDYHEAVRDFRPGPDVEWAVRPSDPQELICHNDFGPWNVVYDGDEPVGVLDWDFAAPGPRKNDVAYALEYAVPFRDDAAALSWHHFAEVPDRRSRLEVFAEAYGLTTTAGLIDDVIARQRLTIVHVEELAGRGLEPQATWVTDGTLAGSEQLVAWAEANRELFTSTSREAHQRLIRSEAAGSTDLPVEEREEVPVAGLVPKDPPHPPGGQPLPSSSRERRLRW